MSMPSCRRLLRLLLPIPFAAVACSPVEGQARQDREAQRARLRSDAVMLAAELIGRSGEPPEELPVSPPPALIDSIHRSLVSIFELEHPARDTIFEMYEIRPRAEGVYSTLIEVEPFAPWVDVWIRGEVTTGAPGIDSILGPLGVISVVEQGVPFSVKPRFIVRFRVPANWYVLRERLMRVSAIKGAGPPDFLIGGGNHLVVERREERWRFRFSVGWGDCPAGCVHRHEWIFEAGDPNGARFMRSSGDSLPRRGERSLFGEQGTMLLSSCEAPRDRVF